MLAHLHFRLTVRFEHRLGQIPQEVVVAVAVRHAREFRGNAGHEGVLLVRDPAAHRQAQAVDPGPRPREQPLHLSGGAGQQRLREPHTLVRQLTHHVQRLMPLLRLQAIDGQDQPLRPPIGMGHFARILLPGGEHQLVTSDVTLDGVHRQRDGKAVVEFGADLRYRPVPGETAMAEPAERVPGQDPVGHDQRRFLFRTDGLGMPRTSRVGAVTQLAKQLHRAVAGEEAALTVAANLERPLAMPAAAVLDFEGQITEHGVGGPVVRHRRSLRARGCTPR